MCAMDAAITTTGMLNHSLLKKPLTITNSSKLVLSVEQHSNRMLTKSKVGALKMRDMLVRWLANCSY